MNHAPNQKLRINRADQDAAAQSGFPPLFYAIKRKFGDRIANIYLRHTKQPNNAPVERISHVSIHRHPNL